MAVQVIRRGAALWDVNRVNHLWTEKDGEDAHEYETIGRVVLDGDLYYIERPEWQAEGYVWKREPRGYALARGAFRALCRPKPKKVVQ